MKITKEIVIAHYLVEEDARGLLEVVADGDDLIEWLNLRNNEEIGAVLQFLLAARTQVTMGEAE